MLAQAELPKMGCYLKTARRRMCVLDSERISIGKIFKSMTLLTEIIYSNTGMLLLTEFIIPLKWSIEAILYQSERLCMDLWFADAL